MKQTDLVDEVQKVIVERMERGVPTLAAWVTQAVVEKHPDIEGSDVEWYALCAHEHVRDTVRQVLRLYKPGDAAGQQAASNRQHASREADRGGRTVGGPQWAASLFPACLAGRGRHDRRDRRRRS